MKKNKLTYLLAFFGLIFIVLLILSIVFSKDIAYLIKGNQLEITVDNKNPKTLQIPGTITTNDETEEIIFNYNIKTKISNTKAILNIFVNDIIFNNKSINKKLFIIETSRNVVFENTTIGFVKLKINPQYQDITYPDILGKNILLKINFDVEKAG